MPDANGAYVKVYIYLLRLMSESSEFSLQLLAERLDETEKDIRRALQYWEGKNLLTVKYNAFGEVTDIVLMNPDAGELRDKPADVIRIFNDHKPAEPKAEPEFYSEEEINEILPAATPVKPVTVEKRPTYSPRQIAVVMEDPSIAALAKKIEKRVGKPLSQGDAQIIMFLVECLQFQPDLIYYLYDYCAERGKTNANYIEKVALGWAQDGIRNIDDASVRVSEYDDQVKLVRRAFGLTRILGEVELTYVRRWFGDLGFSNEMVKEACARTLLWAHDPDFKYADKILSNWAQNEIKTLADIKSLEKNAGTYQKNQAPKKPAAAQQKNTFNSFSQRPYSSEVLASIEAMLVNK